MWQENLPFIFAVSLGFRHAFETDHLAAVSNIVTRRNSALLAIKDGTFWGFGHGSSILIVGLLILLLKLAIPQNYFHLMEGAVGAMIIALGIFRLWQFYRATFLQGPGRQNTYSIKQFLPGLTSKPLPLYEHGISFSTGIIHGLAGSGVLIAAAMVSMKTLGGSFLFLLIFSIGSIAGMMLAAGLLSLPFSRKIQSFWRVQQVLVVFSCIICIVLGVRIMVQNWFG